MFPLVNLEFKLYLEQRIKALKEQRELLLKQHEMLQKRQLQLLEEQEALASRIHQFNLMRANSPLSLVEPHQKQPD